MMNNKPEIIRALERQTMILSYIAFLKQVSMLMSLIMYRCTLMIQPS